MLQALTVTEPVMLLTNTYFFLEDHRYVKNPFTSRAWHTVNCSDATTGIPFLKDFGGNPTYTAVVGILYIQIKAIKARSSTLMRFVSKYNLGYFQF